MPRGRTSEYVKKITDQINQAKARLERARHDLITAQQNIAVINAEISAYQGALDLAREVNTPKKKVKA